jgi:hypothetical protein
MSLVAVLLLIAVSLIAKTEGGNYIYVEKLNYGEPNLQTFNKEINLIELKSAIINSMR